MAARGLRAAAAPRGELLQRPARTRGASARLEGRGAGQKLSDPPSPPIGARDGLTATWLAQWTGGGR